MTCTCARAHMPAAYGADVGRGADSGPPFVEVLGLPGSGKSTVTNALLAARQGRIHQARLRHWAYAPYLALNALRILGPFILQAGQRRRHKWRQFYNMVHLSTLADVSASRRFSGCEMVLLDQGPVYLLSKLHRTLAAPPAANGRVFYRHWQQTLGSWAKKLNFIIQLEASEDELYRRIHQRAKNHAVVYMNRAQAAELFDRTRRAHQHILAELVSRSPDTTIVRIDTEQSSVGQAVSLILGLVRSGGQPARHGPAAEATIGDGERRGTQSRSDFR